MTRLRRGRSPLSAALLVMALGVYTAQIVRAQAVEAKALGAYLPLCTVILLMFVVNATLMFLASTRVVFRVFLAFHFLVFAVFESYLWSYTAIELYLAVLVVIPIAIYERFPVNLATALGFVAARALGGIASDAGRHAAGPTAWYLLSDSSFFLGLVSLMSCLMTRYRESLIPLQDDNSRLNDAVTELTRLNVTYQDYARSAEERSIENERLRLTRDIHDIVGYTLTNTMMMLEAVKLMVTHAPDKIPALIDKARENADACLQEIRSTLRSLRSEQVPEVSTLNAIAKLARIFQQATRIDVRVEYGNVDQIFDEETGVLVYHFVQEGLVNAFRHGKASRILVKFWQHGGNLVVNIGDNGLGAKAITEGIGLMGMRERLEKVDGRLEIESVPTGFSVTLTVPFGRTKDGSKEIATPAGG